MFGTKPDFSVIAAIRSRRSSGNCSGSTTPNLLTSVSTNPTLALVTAQPAENVRPVDGHFLPCSGPIGWFLRDHPRLRGENPAMLDTLQHGTGSSLPARRELLLSRISGSD